MFKKKKREEEKKAFNFSFRTKSAINPLRIKKLWVLNREWMWPSISQSQLSKILSSFWKQIKVERGRKKFLFFLSFFLVMTVTETHFPSGWIKVALYVWHRSLLPGACNHRAWTLSPFWMRTIAILSARSHVGNIVPFTPSTTAPSPLAFPLVSSASPWFTLPDAAAGWGLSLLWLSLSSGNEGGRGWLVWGGVRRALSYCLPPLCFIIPATA